MESFDKVSGSLATGTDFIRWASSEFRAADLHFGHGTDNALDEAVALVMHSLHLPFGSPDRLLDTRLTPGEMQRIYELARRRVEERLPLAYLTGEAWFAGLRFKCDERALVPRSPIAELIEAGFEPWIDPESVSNVLDLCTGGGSIAIACTHAFPEAHVDAVDLSSDALALAAENVELHGLGEQLELFEGDLFTPLPKDRRYDIIVSNPPYVDAADMSSMPDEFRREPEMGLAAGDDGLDIAHRILAEAREWLSDEGILVVEVGNSAPALEAAYPDVEFTWVEFERGGEGVFLLTAAQLDELKGAA